MKSISFSTDAVDDVQDLYDQFASIDPDLSERFLSALGSSFELLLTQPHMGSPREFTQSDLAGTRMWRCKDFHAYLIFYQPVDSGIFVIRVLHEKRDYWRFLA